MIAWKCIGTLVLLLLGSCNNNTRPPLLTLGQVQAIAQADLRSAYAKANSHMMVTIDLSAIDPAGALCWAALLPIVTGPVTVGVATTIEDARLVLNAIKGACAGILPINPASIPGLVAAVP